MADPIQQEPQRFPVSVGLKQHLFPHQIDHSRLPISTSNQSY